MEIKNCTGKELMRVLRRGGDIALQFVDIESGEVKFECWFQMKRNSQRYFYRILRVFEELKSLIKE